MVVPSRGVGCTPEIGTKPPLSRETRRVGELREPTRCTPLTKLILIFLVEYILDLLNMCPVRFTAGLHKDLI